MRVWKYELQITEQQTVLMPLGAKLLDVQMQNGACCLWALCDEGAVVKEPRALAIYGTGNPMPNQPGEYVATFQMYGGEFVFHVFDISEP